MRIDAYAHVVPKQYYDDFGDVYQPSAYERHPGTAGLWDYERRLDHLEKFGIDKQIIALGAPHFWPGIWEQTDERTILDLVQLANDEVHRIAQKYPDHFIPVGTLPVIHDSMIDEFERCIDDLGMVGIQIYTNYEGEPIDVEALHPVYEMAQRRDVPVWLHPQVHDWYDWTEQWGVDLAFGWLFDTTLALTRLVFSGLMERYPDLKLITHHGGGMVPHFMERTKLFYHDGTFSYDIFEGSHEDLTKPLDEYLGQFYYDTVLYGSVPALETVYEVFGPDRMLFATDYPYGGNEGQDFMGSNVRALDALEMSESERAKISSENLLSLI